MELIVDDIPEVLSAPAEQAVKWLNREFAQEFELTGVVDYELAIEKGMDQPFEFGLVLCNGEICKREQVRCTPMAGKEQDRWQFSLASNSDEREIPSLLDPPPGLRAEWLDRVIDQYEFVVLLFYRGLW